MEIRVPENVPLVLPLDAQDLLNHTHPMDDYFPYPPLDRLPGAHPIVPQRFVWHVDHRSTPATRASIQRFGLVAGFSVYDRVFANNQSVDLEFFYPFVLDGLDRAFPMFTSEYHAPNMDIWRIDTSLCSARWHIDPYMITEYRGPASWYICTRDNIPPAALRLYRVLPTWEQHFLVEWRNGAASFVGPRMQIAPYPFCEEEMLPIIERAA